ncbi:MAG: hypothetical protein HY370_01000 [Proteobacteria bacterium]|nr:hypothetical protein [Pseudomonadota bacterium]
MIAAGKKIDPAQMRLSDRILFALELALDQKDVAISETLLKAMELSITRNAGGKNFTERRDYPSEIATAIEKMNAIKSGK